MPHPAPAIRFPKPPLTPEECDSRVRAAVHRAIIGGAQPPDFAQLATALELRRDDVCASFRRLASAGTITLWPDSHSIRLVPPFAAGYGDVRVGGAVGADGARAWWAAGLWHALGIPAALAGAGVALPHAVVCVRDRSGGEPIRLQLVGPVVLHEPHEPEPVAILTRPFAHWWDDPTAAISAVRLLRPDHRPAATPAEGGTAGTAGTVVPLQQLWMLAQAWYADRLHQDRRPRPRTPAEARALVEEAGLHGPEWRLT